MHKLYLSLKKKAKEFAQTIETPSFYRLFKEEIARSRESLQKNNLLRQCINHYCLEQEGLGHGYQHCLSVAIDAGAIVLIEAQSSPEKYGNIDEMLTAVHIAGLLHDIKRDEQDHAIAGAREAEKVLDCFGIDDRFKEYIVTAIRNHEAFKKSIVTADEKGTLISNALYDADKFRWGIDNFTTTVWEMLDYSNISPHEFFENYKRAIDYIERIKDTFRTDTGKKYGPEIIDAGLKIGKLIYQELKKELT